ncbi:MAG: hypothetical protein IJI58_04590 [Bacilli bacterium]|nr:hypothetical protein [Bacilli bacterium]
MNCKKCGSPIVGNDQFCTNCGEPINSPVEQTEVLNPEQPVQPEAVAQAVEPMAAPVADPMAAPVADPMAAPVAEPVAAPVADPMAAPVATPVSEQPVAQPAAKNNNILYIVIGVVVVAALIAGAIIFTSGKGSGTGGTADSGNSGGTATPVSKTSSKATHNGFTFTIPGDYIYEVTADELLVSDEKGTWMAEIIVEEGSFEALKANKDKMKGILKTNGIDSNDAAIKTLGGNEYIVLEIAQGGDKALFGMTKINAMNYASVTVQTKDNEYDYKLLETVAGIVSSAETASNSNSIASTLKPDASKFKDLAK